jgi:hypothetical protein
VAFQNFEEVWAALGRLYSDIVKLQESQQHAASMHAEQMREVTEALGRLTSTVATLAGTVAQRAGMVESHERRLERMEGQ